MKVCCKAVVDEPRLQDNLCNCINILGGKPNKVDNTITVEYDGQEAKIKQFIELFEHFSQHEIHTESQPIAT